MPSLVGEDGGGSVSLPVGETMVGRGPQLKVSDKRVSRNHAVLDWDGTALRLCPKHHNPCFYREAGESEFTALQRNKWVWLHHGDCISLLPGSLLFTVEWEEEVKEKADEEMREEEEEEEGEEKSVGSEGVMNGDNERMAVNISSPPPTLSTEPLKETSPSREEEGSTVILPPVGMVSSGSTGRKRTLPDWLAAVKPAPPTSKLAKPKPAPPTKAKPTAARSTVSCCSRDNDEDEAHPAKRPYKEKPKVVGKVSSSEESVTGGGEDGEGRDDGVSGDGASGAGVTGDGASGAGVSKRLPLCPYGTACYRKNPVHFTEYSHDFSKSEEGGGEEGGGEEGGGEEGGGEESGGEEDLPECPYGTECYRKNPAHRKEYKHSGPPTERPRKRRRRERRVKKRVSALAGDSDDNGEPNTYDYNDSFLDDDDVSSNSSTSYGGTSEDDSEWGPGTYSGEEEVKELVDDAQDFIKNKKMWKPS